MWCFRKACEGVPVPKFVKIFTLWLATLLFLGGCAPRPQTPPATAAQSLHLLHLVRKGDTLYAIARAFGVSVEALKAANGRTDDRIYPGERLVYPWPKGARFYERGIASWYGPGFHGRRTASGEVFDQAALTAAHPRLPFGTRVLVRRVDTGETVVVRINDRGPFKKGRVIDLSRAAARAIGLDRDGTAEVELYLLP